MNKLLATFSLLSSAGKVRFCQIWLEESLVSSKVTAVLGVLVLF